MVDVPVTSSEHSHIGSITKNKPKKRKKAFLGGFGFWDRDVLRTLENYFEGFIIIANHYRPNSSL